MFLYSVPSDADADDVRLRDPAGSVVETKEGSAPLSAVAAIAASGLKLADDAAPVFAVAGVAANGAKLATSAAPLSAVAAIAGAGEAQAGSGDAGGILFGTLGGRGFDKRKRNWDEETLEAIKAAYAELVADAPAPEQAAPLVAEVAPFVEVDFAALPPVSAIDWEALAATARIVQIRAAIAEVQRRMDEEDEEILLLMAA